MFGFPRFLPAAAAALLGLAGCDQREATAPEPARFSNAAPTPAPAPSGLVTVDLPAGPTTFWPFTGTDFSGTPSDPINLVFIGHADPRDLRAALFALDGDRSAFGLPNTFPFNCTWQDAIGDVETGYVAGGGWVGSAIQLACGAFGPLRFHLRFFAAGSVTLAGVHFETQIPATTTHEVLSWELAEQLVVVDFLRSGVLDPVEPLFPTGPVNPSPWRAINPLVYNGLPADLRAAIGGPAGDQTDPIPIANDGSATVLNVAATHGTRTGVAVQDFDIQFGQVIPKPFCASSPADFLYVQGPVHLRQINVFTPSGSYVSQFHATGHLELTPVNPLTDPPTPVGDSYTAVVNQIQSGIMTDRVTRASSFLMQLEIPPSGPFRGRLVVRLDVGPGGVQRASAEAQCAP